jgi:dTDP-4-amino-4,6-dideoxygalactose transaminase
MEVPFFDLKAQYRSIQAEINQAIQSVFERGQFIGGTFVQEFESSFSSLLRKSACIGVGNGTDALLIALKSLGVSKDDEVITPAFGWISASEMITLAGGKPVFVDVLAQTASLDPVQFEARIGPKTRGAVLMHLYGQPGHAHEILRICRKHNLFLIEDCAQAYGTRENGIPVGCIGDVGTFSFYPTKNLGAYGDAGCVITARPDLEKTMRLYANHGGLDQHLMEGINSRMDPMQAAILTVKCKHISKWTESRIFNAKVYSNLLADVPQIILPEVRSGTVHTFHQFIIRAQRRDELKYFLAGRGIHTLVHYSKALHNLPAYAYLNHREKDFPTANQLPQEVLSLPVYPELTQDQIVYVCESVKLFYK